MELTATASSPAWAVPRRLASRLDPPALAAWTLAFALVVYLALAGGGYDTVTRSEVAIAVWWIVLLAALAGLLAGATPRAGHVAIGLLAAFAVWTGLAIGWSESAERSALELGRVAAYLGVLVLAIALQGRTAARHTINGLASAIGLVTALAVLSRLHPQAFPPNDHFEFLGPGSASKLSYPLNYWNALAAFAAMGLPLLLAVAVGARTLAGQAAAAATLPMGALCLYLTISRGGVLAATVGLAAFLLLMPQRLHALATLAVTGAAAAILVAASAQRDALGTGLPTPGALGEGTEMLWLVVIACAGAALSQVAIGLAARHLERPAWLRPGRRATARAAVAMLALVTVVAVAAGVPGELGDRWQDFKATGDGVVPAGDASVFTRLQAVNGNGRYEFWLSALKANATDPLTGIGPGTFELWWAQHGTNPGFVRDAHTLYFETLAETGIAGLALLVGMLLWVLAVAVRRTLREPPDLRVQIAAATGGIVAFMTSAALEWVWEMAAITVGVMVLAAVIVAGRAVPPVPAEAVPMRPAPRALFALLAIAAMGAVALPLAGAQAINDSRAAAADGRPSAALEDSRTAERLQPYAATPHLQQALLLEEEGALGPAAAAARTATTEEPTNWRTWLIRSRIDTRRGAIGDALAEMRRARRLNPYSTLFTRR